MSTRVHIAATVDTTKLTEFMPFLAENLPNVRSFDGCLRVSVLLNEDSGAMVLDEEWLSVEQHQNYLAVIDGNGVLGQLASFFDGPPNVEYFDRVLI